MRELWFINFPQEPLTESNVFDANITVRIAITGDDFVADIDDPGAPNVSFLANILASGAEAGGWNANVQAFLTEPDVGRLSVNVGTPPPLDNPNGTWATIDTTDGVGFYTIAADEEVTVTLESVTLATGFGPVRGTFTITAD